MQDTARLSTGIPSLDQHLGGGLVPGTLTVVAGATGIGKTQLGVSFAAAGKENENRRGIFFDMSRRGDSQSHAEYARRLADWQLDAADPSREPALDDFFNPQRTFGDFLHVFEQRGRGLSPREADFDQWRRWQAELMARLNVTIAFFYGNFVKGARRAVIDGIDPIEKETDSIQLQLFEYVYQQILRKESEWVARDLFRQDFRANDRAVADHEYDPGRIACLLLYTTHETMLDDLIERPLRDGDWLAQANTILYMGKLREGSRVARGLHIAKHRGSACSDEIVRYQITPTGIELEG